LTAKRKIKTFPTEKKVHMLRAVMDHQGLKSPGIYCVPGKDGKEYVGQMGRGYYEAPLASKRSLPRQSILQIWGIIYNSTVQTD
jgi:hypothetical protein